MFSPKQPARKPTQQPGTRQVVTPPRRLAPKPASTTPRRLRSALVGKADGQKVMTVDEIEACEKEMRKEERKGKAEKEEKEMEGKD